MPHQPKTVWAGQLSCTFCRIKKLRCDRAKPRCGRCSRLNEECIYPVSRQDRLGKRRQVQTLESRVAHLEDLWTQRLDVNVYTGDASNHNFAENSITPVDIDSTTQVNIYPVGGFVEAGHLHSVDEPLSTDLLMELSAVYFSRLHQASPMLHQPRYIESLLSPLAAISPLCLRYAVLALATAATDAYKEMAISFYQKARTLAEADEMLGEQHEFITLAHAQCWCLLSYYEAEQGTFTRASISLSRSLRIAQVLGLHRLDGSDTVHLQGATNTTEIVELEERRRTWWVIYICDRFTCASTGWQAQIDDRDITTLLPSSEEAFESGNRENTNTLATSFAEQQHNYSSFAGRVMAAHVFHRALQHTSRSLQQQNDDADVKNGWYWTQLRRIDNDLVIMHLSLPHNLKLPRSFRCQNSIFANITIHTATICLLRSAIWKCQQFMYYESPELQYKARLLPAAQEIANAIRLSLDLQALAQNPLVLFSVYIAALVFLDDIIADSTATESQTSLDVLLHVMVRVADANPVASSMALALSAEIEQGGVRSSAIQKINALRHVATQQQPFPILSHNNALSLQTILHNPLAPANEREQSFSDGANLRGSLFNTTGMDLQLRTQCNTEPAASFYLLAQRQNDMIMGNMLAPM